MNFVDPLGLVELSLDDDDNTLQLMPSGNIINKKYGNIEDKLPYIKAQGQYTITESDAYNANYVKDISRTVSLSYFTTIVFEIPIISASIATAIKSPAVLKTFYFGAPILLGYFTDHPLSPIAPMDEIRAGSYSYTTYFDPYQGSTIYGTYTTVTEGVYGSYLTGTKTITLLPPEYTSRQERALTKRKK